MPQPIYVADAFTDRPFAGNPAAVCPLEAPAPEAWMRRVAAEMNLSETAFLAPEGEAWRLRWFTPAAEVDLCGHATLASAHVLWETGRLAPGAEARFHTRSGLLTATRRDGRIWLDLPATPVEPVAPPDGLLEALGLCAADVRPRPVGRSRFDYLVELEDEAAVRALQPDLGALKRIEARGVIVTARGEQHDFVSRFFAPRLRVEEDPVTGSAHCALGPYWQQRTGRDVFEAHQASARGGTLAVRVRGDRVHLGGHAVTVWRGELVQPAPRA